MLPSISISPSTVWSSPSTPWYVSMNGTNRYQPMMPGDSGLTGQATQLAEAQLACHPARRSVHVEPCACRSEPVGSHLDLEPVDREAELLGRILPVICAATGANELHEGVSPTPSGVSEMPGMTAMACCALASTHLKYHPSK